MTANVHGEDLGTASNEVFAAVSRTGDPPAGVTVSVRGQVAPMQETLDGLRSGLGLAIVAIFLLLAAYFQSLKVALIVIGTIPAVIAGVALSLLLTGSTLNVQSFMGAIMALALRWRTRSCSPPSLSSLPRRRCRRPGCYSGRHQSSSADFDDRAMTRACCRRSVPSNWRRSVVP
jgi:hypothetical protein